MPPSAWRRQPMPAPASPGLPLQLGMVLATLQGLPMNFIWRSPIGGLRTPAPVRAAPSTRGRHPQTFTKWEVAAYRQIGTGQSSHSSLRCKPGQQHDLAAEPASVDTRVNIFRGC
jgi:hypothetical protein